MYQKFAREESVTQNIAGNGLGMYFVKEVVELHHGKINLVSKLGEGSTFTVELPKVQPLPKQRRRTQTERRKTQKGEGEINLSAKKEEVSTKKEDVVAVAQVAV